MERKKQEQEERNEKTRWELTIEQNEQNNSERVQKLKENRQIGIQSVVQRREMVSINQRQIEQRDTQINFVVTPKEQQTKEQPKRFTAEQIARGDDVRWQTQQTKREK